MILTIYHLSFASLLPGLAAHLAPEMTKRGTAAWLAWCKPPRSSASLTKKTKSRFLWYTHIYIYYMYVEWCLLYIYTHRCTCLCLLMYIYTVYIHVFMYLSSFIVLYLTLSYHIYRWIGALDCRWLRSPSMTVPCSTRRLGSPHLPRDDLRGTCNAESGHLAMRCLILFDSSWAMNYVPTPSPNAS